MSSNTSCAQLARELVRNHSWNYFPCLPGAYSLTTGGKKMAKQKNNTSTKENNEPVALQRRDKENVGERLAATPFTFMRRFSEEMDHLFEDFGFGRGWLTPMLSRTELPQGLWSPQVEVFERGNQLVLRADLPGLTRD